MAELNTLTTGGIYRTTAQFVIPYLLACFLQTFYGMADLFVIGLYNDSAATAAVSVGSQVTHMLTVVIVGLAMGVTVKIGQAAGARDEKSVCRTVGTATVFFAVFAFLLTIVLLLLTKPITCLMLTPQEAVPDTVIYLRICFAGVPFITAYNMISSVLRGLGDSKRPMCFAAVACAVNIGLDFLFIGGLHMGTAGAALGTVCGQAVGVVAAFLYLRRHPSVCRFSRKDICPFGRTFAQILQIGVPVAMQDGLIQVAFIVITVIANSRGLVMASGVGIVEKIISFLFLVPSAFLSAISAITAQNMGAVKPERARQALGFGLTVTVVWGCICCLCSQFFSQEMAGFFTQDAAVTAAGAAYLRTYSADCIFAAVHFCFSGYFCGCGKSWISFVHNIVSILLIRIPGAYLASRLFPETLLPMGLAAPLGSLLSALICIGFYVYFRGHRSGRLDCCR